MTAFCFTRFEFLWLFIAAGSKELTFPFFPRINFSLETGILLLYPTVPDLIFKLSF